MTYADVAGGLVLWRAHHSIAPGVVGGLTSPMTGLAAAALAFLLATGGVASAGGQKIEANLEVIGRWEADTRASYGDVAVIGTTAIVATESAGSCAAASATLVDLSSSKSPRAVATIAAPPGMRVTDIDAVNVGTAAFTGDLAAIALSPCDGAGGGRTVFHDVTDPARPRLLGETTASQSVSLAQRPDGRVIMARVNPALTVDDVSDPAHPVTLAQWPDPQPSPAAACRTAEVLLRDEGRSAVVTFADGRVYDLDLTEPSNPLSAGEAAVGGHAGHAAVLLLGNRTIAIVSEEEPGCSGEPAENVLRVLKLGTPSGPVEESPVRFPATPAPGRLIASGTLTYVAWHDDGLRVIDFAEVRPRTVAQFVPEHPEVVAVALLPQHVVVTDRGSGLYVLDRPVEAGGRPTFWTQYVDLFRLLGAAMFLAALLVVPRLGIGRVGSAARSRMPSSVGRRRA